MEEQNTKNPAEGEAVHTEQVEPVVTETQSVTEPKQEKLFNPVVVLIIVGALIIAAGAYYFMSDVPSDMEVLNGSVASAKYPDVVATVNGKDLTKEEFVASIGQTEQSALQQGVDVNDALVRTEIESQAMLVLVNTALLIQVANESGIVATDAEIDAEIARIEAQYGGPEAFATVVEQLELTQEDLRSDVQEQLVVDAYIAQTEELSDIAISEEEVQEAYDLLASQGSGLPPLEEIYDPLSQQLLAQKRQEAVALLIDRLRTEAEIKILI